MHFWHQFLAVSEMEDVVGTGHALLDVKHSPVKGSSYSSSPHTRGVVVAAQMNL
jgi:hypothetical protein